MVEESLFFHQLPFHKSKLILHRASMKCYQAGLESKGYEVIYIEAGDERAHTGALLAWCKKTGVQHIHYADTVDYLLERRLNRYSQKENIQLQQYESPNFICDTKVLDQFFTNRKRYFLQDFYIAERKRNNWLMEQGQPAGGEWSYDAENRKKLPSQISLPILKHYSDNKWVTEARNYVEENFSHNPGTGIDFPFPIDHDSAREQLQDFLQHRFHQFGLYQDAIQSDNSWLFHSHISAALNIGLLNPREVVEDAIAFSYRNNIPLNALEGFIRQIMGWREYIRAVYVREGVKERTRNFWDFTHKMPATFWEGNTGIDPVDDVVRKVKQSGYSNHIERLMVLGNFMCLCEVDPDEIYKWFMAFYIDSYDWVMVPNVYGMSQYADGGLMSTKPYISGSNYILKMSNYKKGDWCTIWDALFWRFMMVHRDFFSKNPRLSMLLKNVDTMPADKKQQYLDTAENFLKKLHGYS